MAKNSVCCHVTIMHCSGSQILFTHYQLMERCYPGLYGITDPLLMPNERCLLSGVETALRGGLKLLQYRNKSVDTPEQKLAEARALLELCKDYSVPLIINDDVLLAKKIQAHGVHLGSEDMSLQSARRMLGEHVIIGITCKDQISIAVDAEKNGASYVAFGRFFGSKTKPDATSAPLSIIGKAKKYCRLPVIAIGGITPENCEQLLVKGADMLAVVHSLFGVTDIKKQAEIFNQSILAHYPNG